MVYSRVSYKLFFLMRATAIHSMAAASALLAEYSEAQAGSPVSHTYTLDDVDASDVLLDRRRWQLVDVRKAHIFTYDIDAYRRGRLVAAEEWADVDAATLASLERELGWHTLIVAKARRADE